MKRLSRFFIVIGATLILLAIFVFITDKILEKQLNSQYSDKLASVYGSTVKNEGVVIQEKGIDSKNFMLFGSSELGSNVPQNPVTFFPTKEDPYYIDVVGRGHVQSLQDTMNIGALGNKLKDKKIGIVVSLQWFTDIGGVSPDEFCMNFSEQQFYTYLNNNDISQAQKKIVAERVYENLKDNDKFKAPALYAKLYLKKNALSTVGYYVFKPYYFFRERLLYSRDLVQSIKYIKDNKLNTNSKPKLKSINWEEETKKRRLWVRRLQLITYSI